MSQPRTVDDLIIGGGAAGFSLATALARADRSSRQIVVIEPRLDYVRDRTWCFWEAGTGLHDDIVSHRWRKWRVRADGVDTVVASNTFEYRHIPADAFYRKMLDEIATAPNVELQRETSATEVSDLGDRVLVDTNRGSIVAGRVFDSRPPQLRSGMAGVHIDLQQHFMGWHVRSHRDIFDPDVVTLMDFRRRDDGRIQFFYVLPFAADEALVEATFISKTPLRKKDYEHEIKTYLNRQGVPDDYQVLWRECGRIPMSTRSKPVRLSRRVYAIGAAAGLVKPSTGYGFLAMQNFSEAIATRLARSHLPRPPQVRSPLLAALDRIFLAVISSYPGLAPTIFAGLFQRVEPDALVRFLSDRARPGDVMAVVNAMPTWPFMRQAVTSAPLWLRP